MKEQIIADIEQKMVGSLDNAQMKLLHQTLEYCFWQVKIEPLNQSGKEDNSNDELLELFITAKRSGRVFRENFKILQHYHQKYAEYSE